MKHASVVITADDWTLLRELLFTPDGSENAAVLLCGVSETTEERRRLVRRIIPVPIDAYAARNAFHLEIAPAFYNEIVSLCLGEHLSPVIVHSHRFDGDAWYSPSDDFGELRLLGVLGSLLPSLSPASLVISHTSATGRELWNGDFVTMHSLRIAGVPSQVLSFEKKKRIAKPGFSSARYDRQLRAFGEEGQDTLSALKVAVVGAGGIGSTVAEQLIRAGVTDIKVVDDDFVEDSNVSRMFGATPRDIGKAKADVLTRHLKKLGGKSVSGITDSAIKQSVLMELRDRDVIFCCVDNDRTRTLVGRFAHQYLIPMIDHGTRLDARNGRVSAAAGRVTLVGSGLTCLRCSHHVNTERIRAESMDPTQRKQLQQEGYVMGIDDPAPAVVSINTVVAGLGVSAGLNLFVGLTGGLQPMDQIYDAKTGSVFPVTPNHEFGCDICDSVTGLKALGDGQVVSAYD